VCVGACQCVCVWTCTNANGGNAVARSLLGGGDVWGLTTCLRVRLEVRHSDIAALFSRKKLGSAFVFFPQLPSFALFNLALSVFGWGGSSQRTHSPTHRSTARRSLTGDLRCHSSENTTSYMGERRTPPSHSLTAKRPPLFFFSAAAISKRAASCKKKKTGWGV
jgi:hypothetical protein